MTSLHTLVDRAVAQYGPRLAALDGMHSVTFADVGERSDRLARALQQLAPEIGSRVGVLLPNRLELVEIDFGIAKAGKVRAPMNPRLKTEERAHVLRNCGADVLITSESERPFVESAKALLPELRQILYLAPEALGESPYEQLLSCTDSAPRRITRDQSEPSLLMHTSGTTGLPKGAVLSERARIAAATHMMLHEVDMQPDDGMIHAAPISHGSGSKILPFFLRGARNIPLPRFTPAEFVRAVMQLGGTCSFVVPTMLQMLLDSADSDALDATRLRNITYGGAPAAPALIAAAIRQFGPVFTQVYGACEALHPVTALTRSDHIELFGAYGEKSPDVLPVGRLSMFTDVEIAGGGEVGEILVSGPTVFSGYWGDTSATADAFAGASYKTGDLGAITDRGYLEIRGRSKDMVITGGLNVYPAEVEATLASHPAVSEVAVVGVPDPMWGEAVAAVVVLQPGAVIEADELAGFCASRLANYKQPRVIMLGDSLPKGATNKILKNDVRRWIMERTKSGMNELRQG